MTETVRERFWRTVKEDNAAAGKMTREDAFNSVLTAFDALLSIISERDARVAELEAMLRLHAILPPLETDDA